MSTLVINQERKEYGSGCSWALWAAGGAQRTTLASLGLLTVSRAQAARRRRAAPAGRGGPRRARVCVCESLCVSVCVRKERKRVARDRAGVGGGACSVGACSAYLERASVAVELSLELRSSCLLLSPRAQSARTSCDFCVICV